jgi:hypothetical protein
LQIAAVQGSNVQLFNDGREFPRFENSRKNFQASVHMGAETVQFNGQYSNLENLPVPQPAQQLA